MTQKQVHFKITATAQKHIKLAIKWKAKYVSPERAKAVVTESVTDFKHHMMAIPRSGKKCQYLAMDDYREMTKGDYRLVYRIDQQQHCYIITLVMFCHVRMDYQTLLNQLPDLF